MRRTLAAALAAAALATGTLAATSPPALADTSTTTTTGAPAAGWERSLGLPNAKNFRDVGGYRTSDGRWVRTGVVFRSNKLSNLTPDEWQRVVDAGITLDVDLRNASERSEDPDAPPPGVRYQVADVVSVNRGLRFHTPVSLTVLAFATYGLLTGSSNLGQSIGYPLMVNFVGSDAAFHDTLTAIADNPGGTVYHCSAGKDRTGWATAVLLTLLGVPRATVEADFLASNAYLGDDDAVEIAWLRSAFAEVNRIYGSFDAYLTKGLGLDAATIATLKAKLLV